MTLTSTETAETEFPYGSFAVALYASTMTLSERPSEEMLLAYAAQGERTLGGEGRVRDLHEYWVRLNQDLMCGQMTGDEHREALAVIWSDPHRLEKCIGLDMLSRLRP